MAYTKAMKDAMEKKLEKVFRECIDEMNAIEIPFGRITEVTVNYRAKRRWGQCCKRYDVYGVMYTININADLLHKDAPIKSLKETLIHEILHTCPDCMCHTGEWKRLADLVNDCYNYNVKRCDSAEEKGMDEFYETHHKPEYKFEFRCCKCGATIKRQRASKFTKYYYMYRCGRCGGEIERVGYAKVGLNYNLGTV